MRSRANQHTIVSGIAAPQTNATQAVLVSGISGCSIYLAIFNLDPTVRVNPITNPKDFPMPDGRTTRIVVQKDQVSQAGEESAK